MVWAIGRRILWSLVFRGDRFESALPVMNLVRASSPATNLVRYPKELLVVCEECGGVGLLFLCGVTWSIFHPVRTHGRRKHAGRKPLPDSTGFISRQIKDKMTSMLVVGCVDQILKKYFRLENIFRLLFPRNLALDCYRARVIHSLQFLKNAWKVNFSCPDPNLFSKMSRVGREETVFRVNSANEVTNNIHSVYWISLSIKNKVGQIQIYKNVIQTHIPNHA